jgi:hypothetical protein
MNGGFVIVESLVIGDSRFWIEIAAERRSASRFLNQQSSITNQQRIEDHQSKISQ